ncbi:tRNA-binding protein [Streptomyces sp. BI20]|uniref:tRNA-binding protein n=1 Tax=Streptomyces sp. BI20 TaxID=3403460 RepID=UPI003C785CC6
MSDERDTAKPETDPAHFFATDIRVGRILTVDEFPEARKPAYKITADFGPAVGTLATSAQVTNYRPEDLKDRLIIGVVNLGAKRIAGYTSRFLVLGSYDADGLVNLLAPEPTAEPGDVIG